MPSNLTYYVGYEFDLIGSFSFAVTNDGDSNAYTATISTGRFFHGIADGKGYADLAAKLQTDLNALASAAASSATWTVAWRHEGGSGAILGFRITSSAGAFSATLNGVAQNVLGMAASLSGAATQDSSVRPYYVIRCFTDVVSRSDPGDFEPDGIGEEFEADDGEPFGITRTKVPKYSDWTQKLEPLEAVRSWAATASVPWTWDLLFEHCRFLQPIVLVDSTSETIAYNTTHALCRAQLRKAGISFRPERETPDRNTRLNIPLLVRVSERFRE